MPCFEAGLNRRRCSGRLRGPEMRSGGAITGIQPHALTPFRHIASVRSDRFDQSDIDCRLIGTGSASGRFSCLGRYILSAQLRLVAHPMAIPGKA